MTSEHDDQAQDQGPKMSADDLWSTAAGFGVTPAHVKMMLAPLVQDIMTDSLKEIPEQIKQMVTHQTDQLAEEIVNKVKAAFGGGIGGGSGNGVSADGVHPLASALLTAVTNKVMGPPAGATPTAGPVQAITDYANSMSTLWGNVLEPILGIYGQGARDERSRLTDLTKMGYEVNIGGPVSGPVANPPAAPPAPRVATMSQPETMKEAARRVAEAIRVGA